MVVNWVIEKVNLKYWPMKKSVVLLLSILLSVNVYCQEKRMGNNPYKFNIGLGTGIGMYGGSSNIDNSVDTNLINAACILFNFHIDYSVVRRLALGCTMESNRYFGGRDSSEKGTSFNIGFTLKYKFVSRDFNNLYVEVMPGYTKLSYERQNNNFVFDKVYGKGLNFQFGLGWDHYFNLHLGMFLSSYYTIYKYDEIINEADGNPITVNLPPENLKMAFRGVNIKLGLLYRF